MTIPVNGMECIYIRQGDLEEINIQEKYCLPYNLVMLLDRVRLQNDSILGSQPKNLVQLRNFLRYS